MEPAARLHRLDDHRWRIHAHAKLNVGLRVFPARADGFHDVETWMAAISWYDTVVVDVGAQSAGTPLTLEITGRSAGVPVEAEKNLAGRAALALAKAAGVAAWGRIILHKVLPHGGGIGGGSADAASTLLALNQAWGLEWPLERLAPIAAGLGSDIPFFLGATPALCTGRGEIMRPLLPRHGLFAVLIVPAVGCPTKAVYQAFDAGRQHVPARERTDWERCAEATAAELGELLVNDLEPGAFFVAPGLAALRDRAAEISGRRIHLTGSGSTLFTLCGSGREASDTAVRLGEGLESDSAVVAVRILTQV